MRDVSIPLNMIESLLQDRRAVWFVGASIALLFLITNLPWQLDDYDQAKQAYTSFEMVKEGHWLYQQTPHEHVATKPPLVGWISAALFAVTRSWNLAWRLPSLLAAIAVSIFLFRAANLPYGFAAGLVALCAFGLNLLTPRLATLVRTDMPLALVIFLIGLVIWQKIQTGSAWDTKDRLSMFALLTVGMLIKGPIVYAFLLPGIIFFQWRSRKNQDVSAWSSWWPWLAALVIFSIWVMGGIIFHRGFFNEVVMREFIGRFGETIHRPQPFYFYLPHLLQKFAPWSVLMLALAIVDLRSVNWKIREATHQISPGTWWLICWIFGGLLVMSVIPSKRVDRIFPVIPPLCLLLAVQIGHALSDEQKRERVRLWSAVAVTLSIFFTGAYSVAKVVTGYRDHRNALAVFGREVRAEAAKHRWRYEPIWASDEGLLLYLRRPRFLRVDDAIIEWNRGNLDALVAPTVQAPSLMRQLHDAALSESRSTSRKEGADLGYVLITR